jgi:dihydrodipicolinate synthase/N-acetylneuraminate lyase
MMDFPALDPAVNKVLQEGTVIPAHPLALKEDLTLDENRQRLLTQYYIASGAGGVAVGVHTTQFEIRKPDINLLTPVLKIAMDEMKRSAPPDFVKVAGVVGPTSQATKEAAAAKALGYNLGLLSMGGLKDYSDEQLIAHARTVASIIPIFGFYLQPAVGGRLLSYNFWRKFADIPNVYAIKVAAFNRYQTLDVVRAVCDSERRNEIALYTGNDDNIVADLVTPYRFTVGGKPIEKSFVGGLLGHWAVWTKSAVELLKEVKAKRPDGDAVKSLLCKGVKVTDMNAALFDVANSFHGCIPGIHEVLRRQGLLEGTWCLNPKEQLSPGQLEELDRVIHAYPEFTDDVFVKAFLEKMNINVH